MTTKTALTLAQQQSQFIARLVAQGRGLSDMTAADRAEAKRLRFDLPKAPEPVVRCRCCGMKMKTAWQEPIVEGKPGYWMTTCERRACKMRGFTFSTNCYNGVDLAEYVKR